MLKMDLPSHHKDISIWLELSTFDELPLERRRKTRPSLAQQMAKQDLLEIEISYGVVTYAIPYTQILEVFPDLDPADTYITTTFKSHRPYKRLPLKG